MATSSADGGVIDPLKLVPDQAWDPNAFKNALFQGGTVEGILKDLEFNAPPPNFLRAGWKGTIDEYTQAQSVDPHVSLSDNIPSPLVGPPANYNGQGFVIVDPLVYKAMSDGTWTQRTHKYGFRFHFNPTKFAESYSRKYDVDYVAYIQALAKQDVPTPGTLTGAKATLNLLLSRRDDVYLLSGTNWSDLGSDDKAQFLGQYYPAGSVTAEVADQIASRGTMYDLEYLFRVINGEPLDTWHGMTSDWGLLFPTAVVISVGNSKGARKIRGIIESIGYTHRQYSPGMVPVYTELSLSITRLPDFYSQAGPATSSAEGAELYASGGVQGTASGSSSGSSGSGTSSGAVPPATTSGGFFIPVHGYTITSRFGEDRGYPHQGIDLGLEQWTTPPVYAIREGTVIHVHSGCVVGDTSCNGRAGNWVVISHGIIPPYAEEMCSYYMHLTEPSVTEGQKVKGGQVIGSAGTTGDSSGTHLHLGIKLGGDNGTYIDPATVFLIPEKG